MEQSWSLTLRLFKFIPLAEKAVRNEWNFKPSTDWIRVRAVLRSANVFELIEIADGLDEPPYTKLSTSCARDRREITLYGKQWSARGEGGDVEGLNIHPD